MRHQTVLVVDELHLSEFIITLIENGYSIKISPFKENGDKYVLVEWEQ